MTLFAQIIKKFNCELLENDNNIKEKQDNGKAIILNSQLY